LKHSNVIQGRPLTPQPDLLAGNLQSGESRKAVLACNDYLRLGPGRSLAKLLHRYQTGPEAPPTKRLKTLKDWSAAYGWQARAAAYDAEIEREKNEALEARRREAMQTGLALDFERVLELKKLAGFLIGQAYEQGTDERYHNIWLPDVKQVGSGEDAQRVDIERFNGAMLEQLRGTLDDLAKETGGRKQKTSVETPDLKSLPDAIRELATKVYSSALPVTQEAND
jgi:hypothetical protein